MQILEARFERRLTCATADFDNFAWDLDLTEGTVVTDEHLPQGVIHLGEQRANRRVDLGAGSLADLLPNHFPPVIRQQ